MSLFESQDGHGDINLKCPLCDDDYVHLQGLSVFPSLRQEGAGIPEERLDAKLIFRCEQGCHFVLHFHQHKGWTYVIPSKGIEDEVSL